MFCGVTPKSAEKIAFVDNIVFRISQNIYEGSKKGRSQMFDRFLHMALVKEP